MKLIARIKRLFKKESKKENIKIIGSTVKNKYQIYALLLSIVSLFEVILMIRGFFVFDFTKTTHLLYFSSYALLLVTSLITLFFIIFNSKKEKAERKYGIVLHIYSFVITIWSVIVSTIDLMKGGTAIVYMTVIVTIAGVLLIDPVFYLMDVSFSIISLIVLNSIFGFEMFSKSGYIINFVIFVIMALFISFKHYEYSMYEAKSKQYFKNLSYTDQLTGLGNEAKYLFTTDEIDKKIQEGKARFKVVLMDVNNLKSTNDLYGHRYGCHLVVKTGHTLPNIFPNSRCFHIGGDEFIVIVENEDYDNFDLLMKKFESELTYKMIHYDEHDIILSVAKGYASYEKGMTYKDVLQKADDRMYQNKKELKEKYNFKSR